MSLLYKKPEDIKYSVEVKQKDGRVNLFFTSDCGKHGMDEPLDEYNLTPLDLLERLQDISDMYEDLKFLATCEVEWSDCEEILERYKKYEL